MVNAPARAVAFDDDGREETCRTRVGQSSQQTPWSSTNAVTGLTGAVLSRRAREPSQDDRAEHQNFCISDATRVLGAAAQAPVLVTVSVHEEEQAAALGDGASSGRDGLGSTHASRADRRGGRTDDAASAIMLCGSGARQSDHEQAGAGGATGEHDGQRSVRGRRADTPARQADGTNSGSDDEPVLCGDGARWRMSGREQHLVRDATRTRRARVPPPGQMEQQVSSGSGSIGTLEGVAVGRGAPTVRA
jgi:hypothetical protein